MHRTHLHLAVMHLIIIIIIVIIVIIIILIIILANWPFLACSNLQNKTSETSRDVLDVNNKYKK